MRFSYQPSFSRYVAVLFAYVLALTVAGFIVAVSGAWAYCKGWPVCVPSAPIGWMKLAHLSLVGVASVLMVVVFRKAWREQRGNRVLLPLTTILGVMFFGQALVGAVQVTQPEAGHLVFLHRLTTIALWTSTLLLLLVSGTRAQSETAPAQSA